MKLTIEIDEARFKDIQRIAEVQLEMSHFQTAEQIIAKGVPLEQEPCEDCISRQAAIDAFNTFAAKVNQDTDIHEAIEIVLSLPPVTPQPKTDVLDKIRAEIEQIKEAEYQIYGKGSWRFVDKCLDIIDKYKAERKVNT